MSTLRVCTAPTDPRNWEFSVPDPLDASRRAAQLRARRADGGFIAVAEQGLTGVGQCAETEAVGPATERRGELSSEPHQAESAGRRFTTEISRSSARRTLDGDGAAGSTPPS